MLSDKILNLRDRYQNGVLRQDTGLRDNISRDLIQPCLKEARLYRRGVGYFSSSALKSYVDVIDHVINGSLKVEIICSPVIQDRLLVDQIERSKSQEERERVIKELSDDIVIHALEFKLAPEQREYRARLLAYLLATKKLEIKFAIPKKFNEEDFIRRGLDGESERNLYHVKYGYFEFEDGLSVGFEGSFNEGEDGFEKHSDGTQVFKSWVEPHRVKTIKDDLDADWNKQNDSLIVYDLSEEAFEKIKKLSPSERPKKELEVMPTKLIPSMPSEINGAPLELKEHQINALKNWEAAKFKGIFALATGAGKTITAITALVRLWESRGRMSAIIAVPYVVLAEQWCDVLELFGIRAVKAYGSSAQWRAKFESSVAGYLTKSIDMLAVVVVNKTLQTEKFQELSAKLSLNDLLFIGDECHHHGSDVYSNKIPSAKYRIGLSATPWRKDSIEEKQRLENVYGQIVATYTIDEALDEGILTPYEYHLHKVDLNDDELEQLEDIGSKIAQMAASKDQNVNFDKDILDALLRKKARLIGSLEHKFQLLDELLSLNRKPKNHVLFFVGDGSTDLDDEEVNVQKLRDIERTTLMLDKHNWRVSRITSEESAVERKQTLNAFKDSSINAIAAIKVLDEGFDMPACREAFLLASSRNERQYIQRRGRILRRMPGKEKALIHDFVVIPTVKNTHTKKLVIEELERVREFARVCLNTADSMKFIEEVKIDWGIIDA